MDCPARSGALHQSTSFSIPVCRDAENRHHPRYVGGFSEGDHLFPFRTEQLSPSAPMVLALKAGRVGRCQLFFFFKKAL